MKNLKFILMIVFVTIIQCNISFAQYTFMGMRDGCEVYYDTGSAYNNLFGNPCGRIAERFATGYITGNVEFRNSDNLNIAPTQFKETNIVFYYPDGTLLGPDPTRVGTGWLYAPSGSAYDKVLENIMVELSM